MWAKNMWREISRILAFLQNLSWLIPEIKPLYLALNGTKKAHYYLDKILGPLTFEVVFQKVDKSALNFKKLLIKTSYHKYLKLRSEIFKSIWKSKGGLGPVLDAKSSSK